MKEFNRRLIEYPPLESRYSKVDITMESIPAEPVDLSVYSSDFVQYTEKIANEIRASRMQGAAVVCAFGAHSIKNGLGRLIGTFVSEGWFTHVCTNGAGIIHDWEFSYLGKSSEDVRKNVAVGRFGTWHETGTYINLAIAAGAYEGLGYGESVGSMIQNNGLHLPSADELEAVACDPSAPAWKRSAALDFNEVIKKCGLKEGFLPIAHPYREYSIHSYIPDSGGRFTCHPMIGHDIIYTHFANSGACIGRTAERDFLAYADSISNLQHGVYLSIGSAVMSPMIFEKSISMARNVALQRGKQIDDFAIHVMDLQESTWDWSKGEPPMDNPDYYLRFMKTFHRMGGRTDYRSCDNRDFLKVLYTLLHAEGNTKLCSCEQN